MDLLLFKTVEVSQEKAITHPKTHSGYDLNFPKTVRKNINREVKGKKINKITIK